MIEKDNVMCGTMVIVKKDFTPVCNWLLGRVVEVYHGSDGKSCISADGIGRLHIIDGTLNVITTIVEPKLLSSIRDLFTNTASFILEQDSASCPTVKRGKCVTLFGGVRGTPRNSSACKQQQGRYTNYCCNPYGKAAPHHSSPLSD
ncbi:hypothetical protein TNCV_4759861 [Trichonephila clavipes]|nr:hypothetical protein TNCV_4759861 [Trichonephila clavipes]